MFILRTRKAQLQEQKFLRKKIRCYETNNNNGFKEIFTLKYSTMSTIFLQIILLK